MSNEDIENFENELIRYNKKSRTIKKIEMRTPDDYIRIHYIGDMNLSSINRICCSTCGETRSVKYYISKNGKIHFLCNKCALKRDLSLDYYHKSIKNMEKW